jgi:hypothetical protein
MGNVPPVTADASFRDVIRLDEGQLRGHVDQVVRATVEQTLNGLLEAEALCGAGRYERSPDRLDTRAGHSSNGPLTRRETHRGDRVRLSRGGEPRRQFRGTVAFSMCASWRTTLMSLAASCHQWSTGGTAGVARRSANQRIT